MRGWPESISGRPSGCHRSAWRPTVGATSIGAFAAAVQRIRGRGESVGAIAALAKRLRGRVAGIADGGASAALRQLMTRRNPRRGGVAAQRLTGERWGCATGGAAHVVGWLWAASTLIDDVRVRFITSTGYRCVSAHRIAWFSHRHYVARAGRLIDHRARRADCRRDATHAGLLVGQLRVGAGRQRPGCRGRAARRDVPRGRLRLGRYRRDRRRARYRRGSRRPRADR